MKNKLLFLLMLASIALPFVACNDDDDDYRTYEVSVQVAYPAETGLAPAAGVPVKLTNTLDNNEYSAETNVSGIAVFTVPVGIYSVSASETRVNGIETIILNASKSSITVTDAWKSEEAVSLDFVASRGGSIIIKEFYFGGCTSPTAEGGEVAYVADKYVVLYNNSDQTIGIGDLCFGAITPSNSNQYKEEEYNTYVNSGWLPGYSAFWGFAGNTNPSLAPGEQIVVSLFGAANNTATYSNSVDLDKASYYTMYDTENGFNHKKYILPEVISSSHWMKGYRINVGSAWVISDTSPGIFIFTPEGTSVSAFIEEAASTVKLGFFDIKKVPVEWVADAIEVYRPGYEADNGKRIPPSIDGGYIYSNTKLGYSLYRNVDKEATEAIEGNAGKIVYSYNLGTNGIDLTYGSTDPSGIDAEASIKKGARIVYKDTNNSGNDFHQRVRATLRD